MSINRIVGIVAVLAVAGSALAAGSITDGNARLDQGNAAGPFGKPLDDNSVAGTTNLYTSAPYDILSSSIQAVRNTWSWRSVNSGGVAQSLTGTATIDSETYVGNVATIKFSNAGTSASGLFKGTLVMTLTQPNAGLTTLNQKLTLELTKASPAASQLAIYNMIDNKLNGNHGNDVIDPVIQAGGNTTIRTHDGDIYAVHTGMNADKYQGDAPGDLFAAGVFSGGNLGNSISSNTTDTASAFQWNRTLVLGEAVTIESEFTVRGTVPTPGAAGVLGLGLLAAGRRRR